MRYSSELVETIYAIICEMVNNSNSFLKSEVQFSFLNMFSTISIILKISLPLDAVLFTEFGLYLYSYKCSGT